MQPEIKLSTTLIDFGKVEIDKSLTKTLIISNIGSSTLSISGIVSSDSDFVVLPVTGDIEPNKSAEFQVTFSPSDDQEHSAEINISSNDPVSLVTTVNLHGIGLSPLIEVPSLFEFGNVTVNEQKELSLRIVNSSQVDLIVANIVFNNLHFTTDETFPLVIKNEGYANIKFLTDTIGLQKDIVTIISNDFNNPAKEFNIQGSGVTPQISIDPAIHNFLNVAVGQVSTFQIIIRNLGLGNLNINNVIVPDPVFTTDKTSFTVAPSGTENVGISFSPVDTSQKIEELIEFISNDINTPDIQLLVSGKGAYPIANISPSSLNFGTIPINSSKTLPLTISNSGPVNLTANLSSSSSVYTLSDTNITVLPGASNEVGVEFKPLSVVSYSATIDVTTNDPVLPIISVGISGAGIIAPKIVVSPDSLDFGETKMREAKQLDVTIKNEGTIDLTYSAEIKNKVLNVFVPQFPVVFSVNNTSGHVGIGSQTTLSASFSPGDIVDYSSYLLIHSNDLEHPQTEINLTGQGIAAALNWRTFNTKSLVPAWLTDSAKAIKEVVPPVLSALTLTTQMLNLVKKFVIDFSDPTKILLEQLKQTFGNLTSDLSSTGVYWLEVLPGYHGMPNPKYYEQNKFKDLFDLSVLDWFDSVKGGYSSFISKVVQSFDDPGDGNRPQFSDTSMAGAFIIMLDTGTLTPDKMMVFMNSLVKLLKIFGRPFKAAYQPPTNISAVSSNKNVRITFSPSPALLPKEFFIFRSEVSGGYVVQSLVGETYVQPHDENGKPTRTWKLVGITNVFDELAKIMKVDPNVVKTKYGQVGASLKQLSKTFFNDQPFRFIFEDTNVENGKTYFYTIAAGYTAASDPVPITFYEDLIKQGRKKPIYYINQVTSEVVTISEGFYSSDVEKKIVGDVCENSIDKSVSHVASLGALSAQIAVTPKALPEGLGGLARCKNYRCDFDLLKEETFIIGKNGGTRYYLQLTKKPKSAESLSITVERAKETFKADLSTYRINFDSNEIFIKSPNYFNPNDKLVVSYTYIRSLVTEKIYGETHRISDYDITTNKKPINDDVKIYEYLYTPFEDAKSIKFEIINSKEGKIRLDKNQSFYNSDIGIFPMNIRIDYSYFSDFDDTTDYFKCVSPENTQYFFDTEKCNTGQTLCPDYENANCVYNTGFKCTNEGNSGELTKTTAFKFTQLFEEKQTGDPIAFKQFWDPIYCQNGIMKQRCAGYSKVLFRDPQSAWPDWNAAQTGPLTMFPVIKDTMDSLVAIVDGLLSGTSKMNTSITNFIDLLLLKIDSLQRLINLIDSYLTIITEDFDIPNLYYLPIPCATGGNEYLKTSIQNASNGPNDEPTGYTAGIVLTYGSPGIGEALSLFFG